MNIVFSGSSGAGKSTLTKLLLQDEKFKNLLHVQQECQEKVK